MAQTPAPSESGAAADRTAGVRGPGWRDRNRLAVVDALLDLYAEGNLRPGAAEVATRSGVSRRSVFRYFKDLDDLDRTAIERQQARVRDLIELTPSEGPLHERIEAIAAQRVKLFAAMAPAGRVARLRAPFHTVIDQQLAHSRRFFLRQVERTFATEFAALPAKERRLILAAADAICSFETYELLTAVRALSAADTRRTIALTLTALLAAARPNEAN